MAQAHFIKKAQKDIYVNGKCVEYVSKKGKREGQTLSKIDRTIPANENDKILIAKGESYYYWGFKTGGLHYSKTMPRPSQLTQSNYLSQLYSVQERIDDFTCDDPSDFESFVSEIKDELENLRDETQGSLDNMPESLQSGPTGELLQERIDSLENAISEFDSIDVDYNEPTDEELTEEVKGENDKLSKEELKEKIEEKRQEKAQEWVDEQLEELNGISLE